MRYRLLFAMLVPAASAFAGCAGGNGCNTDCCGVVAQVQPVPPQLLYPIPGATGVPTAAGSLLFAGTPAQGLTPELLGGASPIPLFIAPAPSALPSPRATPGPAGGTLSSATYPALAARTTYTVVFDVAKPVACGIAQYDAGSFTTK